MRVAILTTNTLHHRYFVNGLATDFDIHLVVEEITYPSTGSPWYQDQNDYEWNFFGSVDSYGVKTHSYTEDINHWATVSAIKDVQIDIGVVFGTGKLQPHIFNAPRWGCVNVHRGISQHYRGLDSELWAIYRNDFENVGVTIHYVDENLDTGDILAQERVVCGKHIELYQLRAVQTITALHMVRQVLKRFEEHGGPIEGTPQEKGRYYKAMPLADKFITLKRFNAHKEKIA
jgi:methionyl-tRNA formyltransferase